MPSERDCRQTPMKAAGSIREIFLSNVNIRNRGTSPSKQKMWCFPDGKRLFKNCSFFSPSLVNKRMAIPPPTPRVPVAFICFNITGPFGAQIIQFLEVSTETKTCYLAPTLRSHVVRVVVHKSWPQVERDLVSSPQPSLPPECTWCMNI